MIEVDEQSQLAGLLYNNLALSLAGHALPTAVVMQQRAVALNPLDINGHINLAAFLMSSGRDAEARPMLEALVAVDPQNHLPYGMMGAAATRRGELDEAIVAYGRAVELAPDDAQAKFNLAAAYLRSGDFAKGWPLYEARRTLPGNTHFKPLDAPEWQGPQSGKRAEHLYVYGEQGVGDKIMFARFLPWARCFADKVTLALDPGTTTLLWGYSRDCSIVLGGVPLEGIDYQVALGRLPALYGVDGTNIPPDPRYLRQADIGQGIAAPGQLKIGLAWAGNPLHPNDDIRSLAFGDVLPLLADPRNAWFSLQVGPRAGDIAKARAQRLIIDLSGNIEGDWSHSAAAIGQMDLIVTADTGVAHLAAALGKPVFVMIPRFSDWRWLWERTDSPWYPTMRLFRQETCHHWGAVVDAVGSAIAAMHGSRPAVKPATVLKLIDPHQPGTADEKEPDVAQVLRKVLRPGDCFVDVGANIGMHTVLGSDLVGDEGRVLAIEPGSNCLDQLDEATRGRKNVPLVVKRPAWHAAESVTLHFCAEGSGGNALWDPGKFPSNARSRECPERVELLATTLDGEILSRGLSPRLIKIDTEGAEQHVLEGALEVLVTQHPPFIVAELHEFGLNQFGHSQETLRAFMKGAGYDMFLLFVDGSKPALVPDDSRVVSQYIVNLLFSTVADVDAVWPGEAPDGPRSQLRYVPGAAVATEQSAA